MRNFTKINHNRAAFTLLEMAVVVTIIGLLAGGIVVTRNFLRNAQLTTMVNEMKFYLNAINQFQTKYASTPGDMLHATDQWGTAATCPPTVGTPIASGTCNGDGDGWIFYSSGHNYETFLAWHHLLKAGMITGNYSGSAGAAGSLDSIPGTNVPVSAVNGVGYSVYQARSGYVSGDAIFFDGFYPLYIYAGATSSGSVTSNPFLTGKEAYRLDEKYDDARPGTGWLRQLNNSSCVTTTNPATALYSTATNNLNCIFLAFAQ